MMPSLSLAQRDVVPDDSAMTYDAALFDDRCRAMMLPARGDAGDICRRIWQPRRMIRGAR